MLIGVIGAPITGKTTLAAGLFAKLKEMGVAAEFVPEYARKYIAKMRRSERDGVTLLDMDQFRIARGQSEEEDLFTGSGTQIIVTDGSVANAYFYMQEIDDTELNSKVRTAMGRYDVLFYSKPFDTRRDMQWDPVTGTSKGSKFSQDPNRVHDAEFSLQLDRKISLIVDKTVGAGNSWSTGFIHQLAGTPEERLTDALRVVTLRLEVLSGWKQ